MRSTGDEERLLTTPIEEDSLRVILGLSLDSPTERVLPARLADCLHTTNANIRNLLRTLYKRGFVDYKPYVEIYLTERGRKIAIEVVRRHRLLETWLVKSLDVPWDQVHAEADRLEHGLSDEIADRMDRQLGYPVVDPHGDPIPDAKGIWRKALDLGRPLSACQVGDCVTLVRTTDQRPEFLRYLQEVGLIVGSRVTVESITPTAGTVGLIVASQRVSLGIAAVRHLLVESDTT